MLDNSGELRSAQAQAVAYDHILFAADGLEPDVNHTLTFTNLEEGKWFGFDYAEILNVVAEVK